MSVVFAKCIMFYRWHEMMKPHGAEDRSQLQLLVEKKPEAAVVMQSIVLLSALH